MSVPSGLRFIDRIRAEFPGVELVVRTRLQLDRDRYLEDHCFNGSYLFPTVFGLEAMAQAAAVLTGTGSEVVRIEDVHLHRPIVVDPAGGTEIEIRALARETTAGGERKIDVAIRSEQTGLCIDHFAATIVLGQLQPGPHGDLPPERKPLSIDPRAELYGNLLFQGPHFQRIDRVLELDADHVILEASLQTADATNERFLLGDPFVRDVLLQAGQLTIPREICLPIRIERIERYAVPAGSANRCLVFAPRKVRHENEYVVEVFVTDARGNVAEKLTGYWLRIIGERAECPSAEDLANIEIRDEELLRATLDKDLPGSVRKQVAVALGRIASASASTR